MAHDCKFRGAKSEPNAIVSNNAYYPRMFSYFTILVPPEKSKLAVSHVNTYNIKKITSAASAQPQ